MTKTKTQPVESQAGNAKYLIKEYLTNFKGNVMSAPRITHVTLSIGCGKFHKDSNKVNLVMQDLTMIAGQKAVFAKAKKSVSNFKIREGMISGCYVTLRGNTMYNFLDQLTIVGLPRIQDFMGLSVKSIASTSKASATHLRGQTDLNIGIKHHHIFPMVAISDKNSTGLNISIGIKGTNTLWADVLDLLKKVGLPFRDSFKSTEIGDAS